MHSNDKERQVLTVITDFYLASKDFNGIPISAIAARLRLPGPEIKHQLETLLRKGLISLNFGDIHPNPHIKAFKEEPIDIQIKKLHKASTKGSCCCYPLTAHLKTIVDQSKFYNRPFTHRLALGEPALSFLSFDLSVLESYRNDPRYVYQTNDISGVLSVSDKYYQSPEMKDSDQVLLQTFGFSYNSKLERAVAVFLRYLSDLSPEHQQIWNAKLLKGDFELHPDYYTSSILGHFPEHGSLFDAIVEEMFHINKMVKLMGRPSFFQNDYKDNKPKDFGFLVRPTLREYNAFVLLLDKMFSENINKKFFLSDINLKSENQLKDGKIHVTDKGTITLFEEWLHKYFKLKEDSTPLIEMFATLKQIRKERQHPAHAINDDVYDQKYFKMQRALAIKACKAIRMIRMIFENHPDAKNYKEMPDWLKEGKIRNF